MKRNRVIAVDFDGTIWDKKNKKLVTGAKYAIQKLHDNGYIIVLWTCRVGNSLKNAINILKKNEMYNYIYCVNETPDFIKYKTSCKVCAGCYIDDRNIGGFIGWDKVLKILLGE